MNRKYAPKSQVILCGVCLVNSYVGLRLLLIETTNVSSRQCWICLEGFKPTRLLTASEAMDYLLELLYAGKSLQRKTFEKRERNAEIYRRYLAGEDSVVLGRVYGLSDRRIRDIIEKERKKGKDLNNSTSNS